MACKIAALLGFLTSMVCLSSSVSNLSASCHKSSGVTVDAMTKAGWMEAIECVGVVRHVKPDNKCQDPGGNTQVSRRKFINTSSREGSREEGHISGHGAPHQGRFCLRLRGGCRRQK